MSLWRSNIKSQPIRARYLDGSRPMRVLHSAPDKLIIAVRVAPVQFSGIVHTGVAGVSGVRLLLAERKIFQTYPSDWSTQVGDSDFIPENNVVFLQSFSLCFDLCSLHQLHVFHHNSLSVTDEQKGSGLVLTKL